MINKKNKLPFITFEGGEGSGKSTQIKIFAKFLRRKNIMFDIIREPGSTDNAEKIRNIFLDYATNKWDPIAENLLMCALRRELISKRIKPSLDSGKWIISDRYFDSTVAYQGYGHQIRLDIIKKLNNFSVGKLKPTLTFIIDTPPTIGIKRANNRKINLDRLESMNIDFHKRVRKGYKYVMNKNSTRCFYINGLMEIKNIALKIENITMYYLKNFLKIDKTI